MARNCTCSGTCSCLIVGSGNVQVSGAGSLTNPFVVSVSEEVLATDIEVADTPTVNMSLFGNGTEADPYIISATATLALQDLTNVVGTPSPGDGPTWDGTQFIYAAAGSAPGAVNAGDGLSGDGSSLTPLAVKLSGVYGTAPVTGGTQDSGAPVYLDSTGRLRAWVSATAVSWASISGKPTTFPSTWATVSGKPSTFPSTWNTISGIPSQIRRIYYALAAPSTTSGYEDGDMWVRYEGLG